MLDQPRIETPLRSIPNSSVQHWTPPGAENSILNESRKGEARYLVRTTNDEYGALKGIELGDPESSFAVFVVTS